MTEAGIPDIFWPIAELRRAAESLLTAAGHVLGAEGLPPMVAQDESELIDWLLHAPRSAGLEGIANTVPKSDLLEHLVGRGPALISVPIGDPSSPAIYFVAVVREGVSVCIIRSDGADIRCSAAELVTILEHTMGPPGGLLADAVRSVPGGAEAIARLFREERLDGLPCTVFSYRRDGASPLRAQLGSENGTRRVGLFAVLSLIQFAISVGTAVTLGQAAVNGLIDRGRIVAWSVISVAQIPLTFWTASLLGSTTILAGVLVKRRLLEGAFFLPEDALRRQGYGEALARLNEASVIERTNVAEILGLLAPIGMLVAAGYVFTVSPYGLVFLAIELVLVLVAVLAALGQARAYRRAYAQRVALTEDVIDKIIGHRTRAVQESPSVRHQAEDRQLVEYARTLAESDHYAVLGGMLGRLWLLAAGAALAYLFIEGIVTEALLVLGVAIFLCQQALAGVSSALEAVVAWWTAWKAVEPLFAAGRQRERPRRTIETQQAEAGLPTVLAASSLSFGYRDGGRSVFRDASLRIGRGERVLIEGPSGGGKTTFAKIVAGELRPKGGSILIAGLDPSTVSENQWRELVASAPQFHENYIFSNTFAFNVDPKRGRDGLSKKAAAICADLGLDRVLAKMPAGAAQLLGETGWQLSHGEQSRVFIARALLQGAKIVVFDESFGALDPITLAAVVKCVRERAATLLVIAHV